MWRRADEMRVARSRDDKTESKIFCRFIFCCCCCSAHAHTRLAFIYVYFSVQNSEFKSGPSFHRCHIENVFSSLASLSSHTSAVDVSVVFVLFCISPCQRPRHSLIQHLMCTCDSANKIILFSFWLRTSDFIQLPHDVDRTYSFIPHSPYSPITNFGIARTATTTTSAKSKKEHKK